MIQDKFLFHRPCPLLQPYVRYYWVFQSHQPLNTFTFPLGCSQIIFHKQTPLYIPEWHTQQSQLTISGQVNFSSHLCAEQPVEMIVVVFHPHAMNAFLHVPAALFYNQEVSGYDLTDKSLHELADRIYHCEDNTRCVAYLEEWLLSRLDISLSASGQRSLPTATVHLNRMEAAIQAICADPRISVAQLSAACCLSPKQFERVFRSFVGISPREYTRIVRFQKALSLMQRPAIAIGQAQLAYASGYADQSHMIREFKRLCGHTPVALQRIAPPYSDLFTTPV